MDVISAHNETSAPSLHGRIKDYHPEADAILQKMLAKQPEERYQTYDELIRSLAGLLAQLAEGASRRSSLWTRSLVGLVLIVAAIFGVHLMQSRPLDASQQLIQLWGPIYEETETKQTLEFDYDNRRRADRLNRLLHYDTRDNPTAARPSIHEGLHWGESDGVLKFPYLKRFDTLEIYGLQFKGTPDFEITLGFDPLIPQDGLRIFFGVDPPNPDRLERDLLEFVHCGEVSQPTSVEGDPADFHIPANQRCRILVQRLDSAENFRFRVTVDVINADGSPLGTHQQNRFDSTYEVEKFEPRGQITIRAQGNQPEWSVSLERIRLEGAVDIERNYDELLGAE